MQFFYAGLSGDSSSTEVQGIKKRSLYSYVLLFYYVPSESPYCCVMKILNRLPATTSDQDPRFLPGVGEAVLWWTWFQNCLSIISTEGPG